MRRGLLVLSRGEPDDPSPAPHGIHDGSMMALALAVQRPIGIEKDRSAWTTWVPPSEARLAVLVQEVLARRDEHLHEAPSERGMRMDDLERGWEPLEITLGQVRAPQLSRSPRPSSSRSRNRLQSIPVACRWALPRRRMDWAAGCRIASKTEGHCAPTNRHPDTIMTSAESDYLSLLATLSLSFVGFSAVVVALRGARGGDLSDRHLRLVRLYIEGGLLVTALAVFPALLNLLHIPATVTWSVSSAAAAFVFSVVLLIQYRRRRAVELGRFPGWVIVINSVSIVAVVGLWFNVAGVPYPPSVGPYAVVLTWALCIFGFIFVRTIELFLQRHPSA